MVFVGDKKYACETCIKGHRSSSCKHTDRPLYEIKKKGRPVTQCEHCRELRKTKQVHVKCMCGSKEREDGEGASRSVKVPANATFPGGLPEELEASVAFHLGSDGSDSDHSGHGSSGPCNCKDGASCDCCTPRVPRGQRLIRDRDRRESRGSLEGLKSPPTADSEPQITQPAGLVVTANSGEYRPVLPRPVPQRQCSPPKAVEHAGSVAMKATMVRNQSHGQMFYSPYGRAYEFTRSADYASEPSTSQRMLQQELSGTSSPYTDEQPAVMSDSMPSWFPSFSVSTPGGTTVPTTLCGCGSSCACAGCAIHRGPNVDTGASCANPGACMGCLDCAMLSIPASVPPDSVEGQQEASQLQAIDDWIRQVSSMLGSASASSQPEPSLHVIPDEGTGRTNDAGLRFDPSMLQTYALWNELQNGQLQGQPAQRAPEECCSGRCKCPAGLCSCSADCCGCCQGCDCAECPHEENPNRMLTFAISGERSPCCGAADQAHLTPRSPVAVVPGWSGQSLTVPRSSLSRASSSSSHSSSHQSYSSTPGSVHDGAASQSEDVRALRSSLRMMNTDMDMDMDVNMHVPTHSQMNSPSPIPIPSTDPDHRTSSGSVEYGVGPGIVRMF
ncbi:hypothetical protein BKA93DRAFT_771315 [Sparassis latifolia]